MSFVKADRRRSANFISLILAVVTVCAPFSVVAAAPPDDLLACASDGHLWFVIEPNRNAPSSVLCHHALDMAGPHYKGQATLAKVPAALACWKNRVWIVMPPDSHSAAGSTGSESPGARDVFTLQVRKDSAMGVYMAIPSGRLDLLPSLPGAGRLASFIGTAQGPVALIMPGAEQGGAAGSVEDGDNASPSSESKSDSDRAASNAPVLLILRNNKWMPIELPPDFSANGPALLAATHQGDSLDSLTLIAASSPQRSSSAESPDRAATSRSVRFDRKADDLYSATTQRDPDSTPGSESQATSRGWRASQLPVDVRRVRSLVSVDGQLAAVLADRTTAGSGGDAQIVYLRPNMALSLANISRPVGRWAIVGLGGMYGNSNQSDAAVRRAHGLRLLEHTTRDGSLTTRMIDPISGQVSQREPMIMQPAPTGRVLQIMLMLLTAIAAILLVFLVRPPAIEAGAGGALGVAARGLQSTDLQLAGFPLRIGALAIDMLPAAIVTMLMFRCDVADLFHLPLLTIELGRTVPFMVMVAITIVHSTVSEAAAGKTLGKSILGASVIAFAIGNGAAANQNRAAAGASGTKARPHLGKLTLSRALARNAVKLLVLLIPPLALIAALNPNQQGLQDFAGRTLVVRPKDGEEGERDGD